MIRLSPLPSSISFPLRSNTDSTNLSFPFHVPSFVYNFFNQIICVFIVDVDEH